MFELFAHSAQVGFELKRNIRQGSDRVVHAACFASTQSFRMPMFDRRLRGEFVFIHQLETRQFALLLQNFKARVGRMSS
jgi:hypothetical protein